MIQLTSAERKKLLPLLEDVTQNVELMLLTGLSTISASTIEKLDIVLREVSRLRLLRFSSSLRIIIEELKRFQQQSPHFSKKRLFFFINRSWLLSHGVMRAIKENNEEELRRLLWSPDAKPIKKLEVVTMGVLKKEVPNTFCSFEFRLRNLNKTPDWPSGSPMVWSCVFPLKANTTVAAEAFLALPQRQKFKPRDFLENTVIEIHDAMIATDQSGLGRISFYEKSKVNKGKSFTEWQEFFQWDHRKILEQIANHDNSPLDLEIEMQQEAVLQDWDILEQGETSEQHTFQIENQQGMLLEAIISKNSDGNMLLKEMKQFNKKKKKPPLFGLLHYERCRPVLQPLSLLEDKTVRYLNISDKSYDMASLLKTLHF